MIKKSGYIALIGKPNVGKSTLMNAFLGQKISIITRKPQTTRHRILGVKTTDTVQMVFIDTPGLQSRHQSSMNRIMNRVAKGVLHEVDVILFLIDARGWTLEDEEVLELLKKASVPVVLAINKVDQLKQKTELLPLMEKAAQLFPFHQVIPISAKEGLQLDVLEETLETLLPHTGDLLPPEKITDRSDQFVITEFVREKLMRRLGNEIPYEIAVTVDMMEEEEKLLRVAVVIWVARDTQKIIVIGKKGEMLKQVGIQARRDLEEYFQKRVFLQLWVKVKANWINEQRSMREFGIE